MGSGLFIKEMFSINVFSREINGIETWIQQVTTIYTAYIYIYIWIHEYNIIQVLI